MPSPTIFPGTLVRAGSPAIEPFRNGVVVCIYEPIVRNGYKDQEWAQVLVNGKIRHHRVSLLSPETG